MSNTQQASGGFHTRRAVEHGALVHPESLRVFARLLSKVTVIGAATLLFAVGPLRSAHGAPNGPAPVAEQPRRSGSAVTLQSMETYVTLLQELESKQELEAILANYADRVDYFDHGVVNKEFIRKDKIAYFARWPSKSYKPGGDITIQRVGADLWNVGAPLMFHVENSQGDWIAGKVMQRFVINTATQPWQITSEKGKITERKKGKSPPPGLRKAEANANVSMAGTWNGVTTFRGTDGSTGRYVYKIVVGSDQRSVETNWTGNLRGPFRRPATRRGNTLHWTILNEGPNAPGWKKNYSLRLDENGTAALDISVLFTVGKWKGASAYEGGHFVRE